MKARDKAKWMGSGALLKIANAASTFLVARMLGPHAYGQVGIARSVGEFFASFGSWRLGISSAAQLGSLVGTDAARASGTLWLTTLLATSLFLLTTAAGVVAVLWFPESLGLEELSSIATVLGAVTGCALVLGAVLQNVLLGLGSGRAAAKVLLLQALAIAPASLTGAVLFKAEGALCGALASQAILIVGCSIAIIARGRQLAINSFDRKAAARELPMLWHYALPGVLAGVAASWMDWTARSFMAKAPGGLTELGKFNAGLSWRAIITFASASTLQASLPNLSALFTANSQKLKGASQSTLTQALALAFYPSAGIALMPALFAAPLGKQYDGLERVLPYQALLVFAFCVSSAFAMVMTWTRRRWIATVSLLATASIFSIALPREAPERTAQSVALALASCWLVHAALVAPWVLRPSLFYRPGQLALVTVRYIATLILPFVGMFEVSEGTNLAFASLVVINLWLDRALLTRAFRLISG